MFYLSFFFKAIAKKPVAAILWGISVLGMLTLSFYGRQATSFIVEKKTVQRDANPYFFALMPKTINNFAKPFLSLADPGMVVFLGQWVKNQI